MFKCLGTILEVQPRVSGDDTGLSNDDIVYGQADNILERLVDKLDIDAADPSMFMVSIVFILII